MNFLCEPKMFVSWDYIFITNQPFNWSMILSWVLSSMKVWNALRNLAPFIQFKKREKYPWRSVTTRLHLCISCFLNCINGTKSRKASHIWYLLNHQKEGTRMRLNGTQIIWRKLWNKSSVWNWELAQGTFKNWLI